MNCTMLRQSFTRRTETDHTSTVAVNDNNNDDGLADCDDLLHLIADGL